MMKRRDFIYALALGASGLTGIYSWKIEPYWVEYVYIPMPIKNLPQNLIGSLLIQISDLHIGNRFNYDYQISEFRKIKAINPDFIVYTGDFITHESNKQFSQLTKVFKYAPKGKLGTFGILGNHDYGKNWKNVEIAESIVRILNNSGISVLRNQIVQSNNLNLIGLDDYWGPNFYPKDTLAQINHDSANIVLCHNPDALDLDIWNNYKGWILSGHTHGGQCKPPFLPPPLLPVKNKRYSSGKIDITDGRTLYINRALGHLWPVRFNVRPEITIFNLQKAS